MPSRRGHPSEMIALGGRTLLVHDINKNHRRKNFQNKDNDEAQMHYCRASEGTDPTFNKNQSYTFPARKHILTPTLLVPELKWYIAKLFRLTM